MLVEGVVVEVEESWKTQWQEAVRAREASQGVMCPYMYGVILHGYDVRRILPVAADP